MREDFIEIKKVASSNNYVIRVYFSEIDSEINISFTEENFIQFLSKSVEIINNNSKKVKLKFPENIQEIIQYNEEAILQKIKARFSRNKPTAEVFIYIPDAQVSLMTAENITNAAGEFMESLGFELETEDQPVFGSFFQKLRFLFSRTIGNEDLETLYAKGKKALDLKYVELPTAEQTEKLAVAAEKLIASLGNVKEGVIRCGALIVLKKQVDGEQKIIVQQLSTELIILLDKKPKLLFNLNTVYEILTGDIKGALDEEEAGDQAKIA